MRPVDVNVDLRVHDKVEDREKVTPELGDMEDSRKLDRTKGFTLPDGCEEDSANSC